MYNTVDDYGRRPTEEEVKDFRAKCKGIRKATFRVFMLSLLVWLPSLIVAKLLPSTQEMAIIYVVPKVINNQGVQDIPDKLVRLSSEWIDAMRPSNIKEEMGTVISKAKK
jgi:hypothetical protein